MLKIPFELGRFPRVISLSILTGLLIGFPIGQSLKMPTDLVAGDAEYVLYPQYSGRISRISNDQQQLIALGGRWSHESLECPFFGKDHGYHAPHSGVMTKSGWQQFKSYFGEIGLGENQTRIFALAPASVFKSKESKTGYLLNVVLNAPESELPSYQASFEVDVVKQGNKLMISSLKAKHDYKVSLQKFVKLAKEKALGHIDEEAIRLFVGSSFYWSETEIHKLEMASRLSPDFVLAHIKKSRIHAIENDYKNALLELNEVIRILPGCANAYIARGIVKSKMSDFKGAVADLDSAIKLAPSNHGAYFFRGRAFLELEKFDEALADFSKAEKLKPTEFAYPGEVATALFYKKQFKAAIKKFDKCLLMKGNSIGYHIETNSCEAYLPGFFTYADRCTYFDRGLAYHWLGEKEKARADYKYILTSNYGFESKLDAITGIARLRIGQDNPDRIVADFDSASKEYRYCKTYPGARELLLTALKKKS